MSRTPGRPPPQACPTPTDPEVHTLRQVCDDASDVDTVRDLLVIERRFGPRTSRAGLLSELEKTLRRGYQPTRADLTGRQSTRCFCTTSSCTTSGPTEASSAWS